jgi:hypothetical protein
MSWLHTKVWFHAILPAEKVEELVFLILNQVGDRRDACPAAGCKFEFSAKTIQPLTKLLREELENFEPEENLQSV